MTNTLKNARAAEYAARAAEMLNAGFASKARQQDALALLTRAFDYVRDVRADAIRDLAPGQNAATAAEVDWEARGAYFAANELPFQLNHVREKHAPIFADRWAEVQELVALREAIKAAPIQPSSKVETVATQIERRVTESLQSLMERRKAQFIEGCELHDIFKGLPVSINAHWVYNPKGADFIRRFYYMNGKLTPLAIIIAVLEAKEKEEA